MNGGSMKDQAGIAGRSGRSYTVVLGERSDPRPRCRRHIPPGCKDRPDLYLSASKTERAQNPQLGHDQSRTYRRHRPEGKLVDDSGLLPTVEAPMHLAIYRARPDVNAIVHSHAVWSSTFAVTGKNIPLILSEQSLRLGGEVICAAYGKVGSEEIARNIVAALGYK